MSDKQYFVSCKGQQDGPFDLSVIVEKITAGELTVSDYLYDDSQEDWVMLMAHPDVAEAIKSMKPQAPPKPKSKPQPKVDGQEVVAQEQQAAKAKGRPEHMVTEWYVLKGENKFGPFMYTDVIKMLQEKVVFEFDFAWHPGMSTWQRIAEMEAFKSAEIEKLQTTLMPEISEVFFRRRHRRVEYGGTILVHDNNKVWKGRGVEISSGGAGVVMENAMLVPGQTIYLHFKPGDGVPPFNAICEVVSKKYVDGVKDKGAPIQYGLKFKSISESTQKVLSELTKNGKAAA